MKTKLNNTSYNLTNPLMIAYLIFIFITMIVYCVSSTFKLFDFSEWNRIVIAVTVSSYFFTSSSNQKFRNGLFQKKRQSYIDYIDQVEIIKSNLCSSKNDNTDTQKCVDSILDVRIKEINNGIDLINRKIKRSQFGYYTWCTLGFLSFLIILFFNGVSDFLANSQSMLTVMAFFLMLVYEEIFIIAKKKINEETLDKSLPLEEVLQLLAENGFVLRIQQEEENGQDEDAE